MHTLRIFTAIFIGAFLGCLLSMQAGYAWPLGCIAGGFIAYILYDLKAVGMAIKKAHNEIMVSGLGYQKINQRLKLGYDLVKYMSSFMAGVFAIIVAHALPVLLPIYGYIYFREGVDSMLLDKLNHNIFHFALVYGGMFTVVFFLCSIYGVTTKQNDLKSELECFHRRPKIHKMIQSTFTFEWKHISGFCHNTLVALRETAPLFKDLVMLPKRVFFLIHSELRLLCGVDASLGAMIGYICGNALIGATAGAAFGLLNYWLVSVCWLKLKHARA